MECTLFLRISDFDRLTRSCDGLEYGVVLSEFQGFLHALTIAFQGSIHVHPLTPAVLLAAVPTASLRVLKNASAVLPLLDAAEAGCSCKRRYDPENNFNICSTAVAKSCPISNPASGADFAAALRACLGREESDLVIPPDLVERLNTAWE